MLAIFLQSAGTRPRIIPGLFGFAASVFPASLRFAAIFAGDRACRGLQIFRRFARVGFAAFQFALRFGSFHSMSYFLQP